MKDDVITYTLVRQWDPAARKWGYVLRAKLPLNNRTVDTVLDQELGCVLGQYWRQHEESGSFMGSRSMKHIIRRLAAGEDI